MKSEIDFGFIWSAIVIVLGEGLLMFVVTMSVFML